MKDEKIVTINGQRYDSATGMPMASKIAKPVTGSNKNIHSINQRVQPKQNPASGQIAKKAQPILRKNGRSMDIARSKSISHFAARTKNIKPSEKPTKSIKRMDVGPIKHHIAAKVEKKLLNSKEQISKLSQIKSLKTIKENSIAEALNKPKVEPEKTSFLRKYHRIINLSAISLVVLLIIGYFTYLNIPSLSVKIASAQAGIGATYPDYHPDGYSLNGPVTYTDGEVIINFKANTGESKYIIKQARSTWDSSAVKNMVNNDSNGEFITTEENGLTIYTYNGNATWVNGGVLYTISSDSHLSGDQIRRIATSL